MAETFLVLLAAHLVADFPLQPDWMIRRKNRPQFLVLHVVIVGIVAVLFLAAWPAKLLAILLATHLAMDAVKAYFLKDTLTSFALDQFVHVAVIAGLSIAFPATVASGHWPAILAGQTGFYFTGLCLLSGLIAAGPVGAIIVRKATAPFLEQIQENGAGLQKGGTYIGYLERSLVLLLILINQPAGVGFLITAKSILRFGDVKEDHQRKLTEYVIIGTFMSFGWGLLVAVVTQIGFKHWQP